MPRELGELRARLTPATRSASYQFCSVEYDALGPANGTPEFPSGERLLVRLGVQPGAPSEIWGYICDEQSGDQLAVLRPQIISSTPDAIACAFLLPADLPGEPLCLVIEGRWAGGQAAGCEIGFRAR